MKKIIKEEFESDEKENVRKIDQFLQEAQEDPKVKIVLVEDAREIIQDKNTSNRAKAHSVFLLGKMKAENATEQLIDLLDKPLIEVHEKRMPYGQADAFTALVMIGEKALPVLKEKIDIVSESKLRGVATAIYHISRETSFIRKKIEERIRHAGPTLKPDLERLLQDINSWQ